jgi:hypothetical protein
MLIAQTQWAKTKKRDNKEKNKQREKRENNQKIRKITEKRKKKRGKNSETISQAIHVYHSFLEMVSLDDIRFVTSPDIRFEFIVDFLMRRAHKIEFLALQEDINDYLTIHGGCASTVRLLSVTLPSSVVPEQIQE